MKIVFDVENYSITILIRDLFLFDQRYWPTVLEVPARTENYDGPHTQGGFVVNRIIIAKGSVELIVIS